MFKLIALTGLLLSTASASTIFVQPGNTFATQGGSFPVGINVASISDLSAYQFDLSFDPTILAATTWSFWILRSSTSRLILRPMARST